MTLYTIDSISTSETDFERRLDDSGPASWQTIEGEFQTHNVARIADEHGTIHTFRISKTK